MTAKYQFYKNPRLKEQEGEEGAVLHARIVEGRTVRFDKLCDRIAGRSSFNVGEVMGIMNLFKEEMIRSLMEGDKVEVAGIGCFSATAQCPPIQNAKEIRAESIHFSKVVFRAAKELKKELSVMRFERAADYRKADPYTAQERRERILCFLQNKREMRSSECMGLNRCSRYVAQMDLKYLYDNKLVSRLGGPKVAVYVLPDHMNAL